MKCVQGVWSVKAWQCGVLKCLVLKRGTTSESRALNECKLVPHFIILLRRISGNLLLNALCIYLKISIIIYNEN